jgi:hypothetical protein
MKPATNRLSHGTHYEARSSPKPAVPKVCPRESKEIRDQFPCDPPVHFCNGYFEADFFQLKKLRFVTKLRNVFNRRTLEYLIKKLPVPTKQQSL